MSDVLVSMSSVKIGCWERTFFDDIQQRRIVENAAIGRAQTFRALSFGMYFAAQTLAALAAFSCHAALHNTLGSHGELTVGKAASVLALLSVAKEYLYIVATQFSTLPEILVACQRIGAFFQLPEVPTTTKATGTDENVLRLENAAFAWDGDKSPVVESIDVAVARGELVCVVGKSGVGKSALLHGCLQELDLVQGFLHVEDVVALSPQRPWNVSGSIRANVLLGGGDAQIDEDAYEAALTATALDSDCSVWTDGDATIVGERGLTLSGGQAARLALARCVYACARGRAHLALLDDPLSAVDPHVAQHLMDDCIVRKLCGQGVGVLLATHQRQFLDRADRVLVLSDGRAIAYAPLAEILENGGDAADLVKCDNFPPGENDLAPTTPSVAPPKKKKKQGAALEVVAKEDREVGEVSWRTWSDYIGAGGVSLVIGVITMFFVAEGAMMYSDFLLLTWTGGHQRFTSIYMRYVLFASIATIFGGARCVVFFAATRKANTNLHARALQRILYAPLAWIQANPLARILNRFASDLAQADDLLSMALIKLGTFLLFILSPLVFAIAALPYMVFALPLVAYAVFRMKRYISKSMNEYVNFFLLHLCSFMTSHDSGSND